MSEKARESKVRRRLSRMGYYLRKSRIRNTNIDNWGGYMITDLYTNSIVAGMRFDLTLDEAEQFANG